MARVSFTESDWSATTSPKTVASQVWSQGDVVVVTATTANDLITLNTPTNANLSFSLAASIVGPGGDTVSSTYVWTATAASAQTGQTIELTRSASAQPFGFSVEIYSGRSGTVGVTAANNAEATLSLTVAVGSDVVYIQGDWNASAGSTTVATGSGTATELTEQHPGSYTIYVCDWTNVSAGTFGFGLDSYTGMSSAQAAIELPVLSSPSGAGASTQENQIAAGSGTAPEDPPPAPPRWDYKSSILRR